jgi:hypothetical protein
MRGTGTCSSWCERIAARAKVFVNAVAFTENLRRRALVRLRAWLPGAYISANFLHEQQY